ncbi:IcmQ protein (plasmid) [Legionella adelaidensis]|uniref:IcmQ n=1 Tax=Legionella adelaidensis TaxID=45056 RepID=Q49J27_9GAMM|nr:Dot/Icm secretion system protein IcmQ [Legionella adelaidensis]AAX56249.1 IcmQ [Legionella adelaidensis]KTC66541.1 IcmQ protein [Legionella adelaidensis]VEH81158.1 IcmQ protein [Legionella adelaidensis]
MKEELSEQQHEAILKALEEAIESGPWEESSFLRIIGKNLRDIRDKYEQQIQGSEKNKTASNLATQTALHNDQIEVFIGLYSFDGSNMQSWERILTNLPRQMISRPIYAEEQDIKNIIRTKENKINEAYVAIYINQLDILPTSSDKTPTDKLGKALLTLKDKSLSLENITRFVHISGIYKYNNGRLLKTAELEE